MPQPSVRRQKEIDQGRATPQPHPGTTQSSKFDTAMENETPNKAVSL